MNSIAKRGRTVAAVISILVSGWQSPAGANPSVDYTHIIEKVLIEDVEVRGVVVRELLLEGRAALRPAVDQWLIADRELRKLAEIPPDQRTREVTQRADEVEYQQALENAISNVRTGSEAISQAGVTMAETSAEIDAATDAIKHALDLSKESASYRHQITNAAEHATAVDITTLQDNIAQLDTLFQRTIALLEEAGSPAQPTYGDSLDSALSHVEDGQIRIGRLETDWQGLVDHSNASLAALDEAQHASDMTPDIQEHLTRAQTHLLATNSGLSDAGTQGSGALPPLDAAYTHILEAQQAGEPQTVTALTETYSQQLEKARVETEAAREAALGLMNTNETAQVEIREAVAALGQPPIADARVASSWLSLGSSLSTANGEIEAAQGFMLNVELTWERALLSLADINSDSVTFQGAAIDASIASYGHFYEYGIRRNDLEFDPDGQLDVSYQSAEESTRTTGDGVHGAVGAVDEVQGEQEGTTWEEYDESPGGDTGFGEQVNGCRRTERYEGGIRVYVYYGDDGDNACFGTVHADVFHMRAGNDYVDASQGADQLHMASGEDEARANEGHDLIWGGAHADTLYGADGNDELYDREENSYDHDYISGGPGSDYADMQDTDVEDSFFGGDGNDPEPAYDRYCYSLRGCRQDYWESAGGAGVPGN
jgi:Ca2+-binding RTX toxin-like protein